MSVNDLIDSTGGQNKFIRFKQWFRANGGFARYINFPVYFEPGNYLGMSAEKQIAPNTVILAVPKTLTIGITTVKDSELK